MTIIETQDSGWSIADHPDGYQWEAWCGDDYASGTNPTEAAARHDIAFALDFLGATGILKKPDATTTNGNTERGGGQE